MNIVFYSFIVWALMNCQNPNNVPNIDLGSIPVDQYEHQKLTAYFFFIADCPASRNNLPKMQKIQDRFQTYGLRTIGVVSDPKINRQELDQTLKTMNIEFPIIKDERLIIAKQFNAQTTPQILLFNEKEEKIYDGALDDYYISLGKHKNQAHQQYYRDAIIATLAQQDIRISHTKAIGCDINFDY